jgi:predicted RNase H-like HicB family nuclease
MDSQPYESDAKEKSMTLANALGSGWVPEHWKNFELWHYEAIAPKVHVGVDVGDGDFVGYVCRIESVVQFVGEGETPQEAINSAIEVAKEHINKINSDIVNLLEATTGIIEPWKK